jgi:geranylgeranyl pyrophosphate synthase
VTLPTIFYLNRTPVASPQWRRLEAIVAGQITEIGAVDEVIRSVRESGAIDQAITVAQEYVARAKAGTSLVPDEETRELLSELADLAVHRVS